MRFCVYKIYCVCNFKFVYLVLAALGLCCCVWLSLVAVSWGHSPAAVCGLLIAAAALVMEHGL